MSLNQKLPGPIASDFFTYFLIAPSEFYRLKLYRLEGSLYSKAIAIYVIYSCIKTI